MIPIVKGYLCYPECSSQGPVFLASSRKIPFNEFWTNLFFLSLQRRYLPAVRHLLTTIEHQEAEGLEDEGEL
jgi:hypothetical protein